MSKLGKTVKAMADDPLLLLDIHHTGYFGWGLWVGPQAPELWTAETVDRLIRNPSYKMGLNLGAQSYEQNPSFSERIRLWLGMFPDRLFMTGGDYAQPTACVRYGESNLRQILVGWEEIRKLLGVAVDIWTVSEPGNFAQLPQILTEMGYRAALLRIHGPGQDGSPAPTADAASVTWAGPDGTEILAVPEYVGDRLKAGDACTYSMWIMTRYRIQQALRGNYTLDDLWRWKLEQSAKGIAPVVMSKDDDHNNQHAGNNLCMDAGHMLAADTEGDKRFRWVTADELFAAVPVPEAPFHADPNLFETRVLTFCDYGFMGNRDWIADTSAEAKLRMADFAAALAARLVRDVGAEADMLAAWKCHLSAQNHDLSLKNLFMAMTQLQYESARIADDVFRRSASSIARRVRTNDGIGALVVFNSLGHARTEYAVMDIPGEWADGTALFADGRRVPAEIVSRQAEIVKLGFVANVPALGYRAYSVRPDSSAPKLCNAVVAGKTVTTPHYTVTFGEAGGIESLVPAGFASSVVEAGSVGISGDLGGAQVKSAGEVTIDVGAVSVLANEKGWLSPYYRYEITYRMVPEVPSIAVHVRIVADFKEGTPGAPGTAGDPVRKIGFGARLPAALGNIRCVRKQPMLVWEYDPTISPIFAALSWVDYAGDGVGLALLNNGAIGQRWDTKTNEVSITLASGRIDDYRGEFALYPHVGDWKGASVHRAGLGFANPLVGIIEKAHTGSLPVESSLAGVEPENVTVSSVFREKRKTYIRLWEHAGEEAGTRFTRDGKGITAERVTLRLRRKAGGAIVQPRQIATFRLT